mmetsp:Transcript_67808/g.189279  ORF Transcript_67808/g.189279 Transcript_67808/m.189279 type:complete len:225 (-) Transcript_67808:1134-1808(-)
MSGVQPSLLVASTAAPVSTRNCTALQWPYVAAYMSAVHLHSSVASTDAPRASSCRKASVSPSPAACIRKVLPASSVSPIIGESAGRQSSAAASSIVGVCVTSVTASFATASAPAVSVAATSAMARPPPQPNAAAPVAASRPDLDLDTMSAARPALFGAESGGCPTPPGAGLPELPPRGLEDGDVLRLMGPPANVEPLPTLVRTEAVEMCFGLCPPPDGPTAALC